MTNAQHGGPTTRERDHINKGSISEAVGLGISPCGVRVPLCEHPAETRTQDCRRPHADLA